MELTSTLAALDTAVGAADVHELPEVIGRLISAAERARLRIFEASQRREGHGQADENISTEEAARRLGISKDWLYRNAGKLPFTVKIGRRVLFSSQGLQRWNRHRLALGPRS